MAETARLRIPLLAAGQAQKHVTVNEGWLYPDTLVQAAVLGFADAPAGGESDGDAYIVGAGTGAFTGWDNRIAVMRDGEWVSFLPGAGGGDGWRVWNRDDGQFWVFDGSGWRPLSGELVVEPSEPAAPPAGHARLYVEGTDLKLKLADGSVYTVTMTLDT